MTAFLMGPVTQLPVSVIQRRLNGPMTAIGDDLVETALAVYGFVSGNVAAALPAPKKASRSFC